VGDGWCLIRGKIGECIFGLTSVRFALFPYEGVVRFRSGVAECVDGLGEVLDVVEAGAFEDQLAGH